MQQEDAVPAHTHTHASTRARVRTNTHTRNRTTSKADRPTNARTHTLTHTWTQCRERRAGVGGGGLEWSGGGDFRAFTGRAGVRLSEPWTAHMKLIQWDLVSSVRAGFVWTKHTKNSTQNWQGFLKLFLGIFYQAVIIFFRYRPHNWRVLPPFSCKFSA